MPEEWARISLPMNDDAQRGPDWRQKAAVCLLLAVAVFCAYAGVRQCELIALDDPSFIQDNPIVRAGLSWRGLQYAFGVEYLDNWHPLVLLSFMLDCQLFGPNPAALHWVNLGYHLLGTVVLFLALTRLTGATARSAVVAALFGLHPLHVESVAWISERKDVLSGLFWAWALWAYAGYARRPGGRRYGLVLVLFTLGLMSKPMMVTFPCVLLLLDWWPLRRWGGGARPSAGPLPPGAPPPVLSAGRLWWEKLPFFALTLADCLVTYWVQKRGGGVASLEAISLPARLGNAAVSYVTHVARTLWPEGLAVIYPYQGIPPVGAVLGAVLGLLLVSLLCLSFSGRRAYLLVGWLWFLGVMVPAVGIVQVGLQSMADRHTYLPSIGLFLMAVWGVGDWLAPLRHGRWIARVLTVTVLSACLLCTSAQVRHWRNSETLFRHALAVTTGNAVAHYGLGRALMERGQTEDAAEQFRQALRLRPDYANPNHDLGVLLLGVGRPAEAAPYLAAAVQADPGDPRGHLNYALALERVGQARAAVAQYAEAARGDPGSFVAHNNLAWLLATHPDASLRDGPAAVAHARRACELTEWKTPFLLGTLAAACAEAGQFAEAVQYAEQTIRLATAAGQGTVAEQNRQLLQLYRAGRPFRQGP